MNHKPLLLTVALLALLITSGAFWMLSQRTVKTPVVPQPTQTETPTQSVTETYSQHIEAIPGNTDEMWYNIPELGVRMKLNKGFAEDLVYKSDGEAASFQKKSILAASSQCSVESADSGYLYKIKGTIKDADQSNVSGRGYNYFSSLIEFGMIIQLPNFFVALSTDHSDACWWGKSENKVAEEASRKVYDGSGYQSIYAAVKNRSIEVIDEEKQ